MTKARLLGQTAQLSDGAVSIFVACQCSPRKAASTRQGGNKKANSQHGIRNVDEDLRYGALRHEHHEVSPSPPHLSILRSWSRRRDGLCDENKPFHGNAGVFPQDDLVGHQNPEPGFPAHPFQILSAMAVPARAYTECKTYPMRGRQGRNFQKQKSPETPA